MTTNWATIIRTTLTVIVGLVCAILALTLAKEDATAKGLLFGVAGTALGSFLKQPHKARNKAADDSAKAGLLSLMLLVACMLASSRALATEESSAIVAPSQGIGCIDAKNTYCVVFASATAWSLPLKDFTAKSGAVLLGLSLRHQFGTLPIGLGVYGGLGASGNGKSYQACLGLSITNWALVCGGVQALQYDSTGATAWQGIINLALQAASSGVPN